MLRTFRYLHLKWICQVVTHTHTHTNVHTLTGHTHTHSFFYFFECVKPSGCQSVSLCHRVELCGSSRSLGGACTVCTLTCTTLSNRDAVCLTRLFTSVSADKAFKRGLLIVTNGSLMVNKSFISFN